jgi:hypothetical protein
MRLLGKILGLLVILWLGCMALNVMDSYGLIGPPPPATKPAVPAAYNPSPDIAAMGAALGEVAKGTPRKTDGMSDLDWCLADERYWLASGAEVPADSECQGQTMAYWHAQRKVAS